MSIDLERIENSWPEFREKLKTHYGNLSDEEADAFRVENRAQLMTLLDTEYGMAAPQAEAELDEIMKERPASRPKGSGTG